MGDGWKWRTGVSLETEAGEAIVVDGPTLRSVRDSQGMPLRRIARAAGTSHGHLSKVETGEPGRPVTPRIIYAYEKLLGIRFAEAVAASEVLSEHRLKKGKDWPPRLMTEHQRRTRRSQVAAVGTGGAVGMPVAWLLHWAGQVSVLGPVTVERVASLEQIVTALEEVGGPAWTVDGVTLELGHDNTYELDPGEGASIRVWCIRVVADPDSVEVEGLWSDPDGDQGAGRGARLRAPAGGGAVSPCEAMWMRLYAGRRTWQGVAGR
jgi:transcriptional regulator with XRE-family HTH domain